MTFALIVGVLLACWSAALYCQSDVRRVSPECDDTASTPSADGAVEALPAPARHMPGAGKISERPVLVRGTGSVVAGGAPLRTPPATPTARQLHPSTYSERWWAEFQSQPPLVPRRHLSVVEHEARLARAASEFTERDPANPRGIRRPIIEED